MPSPTHRLLSLVGSGVLVLGLAACGDAMERAGSSAARMTELPDSQDTIEPSTTPVAETFTVEVLDHGSGRRRSLVVEQVPQPADNRTIVVESSMSARGVTVGLGTIEFTANLLSDGDAFPVELPFIVRGPEISTEGVPPALARRVRRGAGSSTTMTGSLTRAANGGILDEEHRVPSDATPRQGAQLSLALGYLALASVPLPTEPVAEGARWRAQLSDLGGSAPGPEIEYLLEKLSRERYVVTASIEEPFFDGSEVITAAQIPDDPSGTARYSGRLSAPFPDSAAVAFAFDVDVPVQGETIEATVKQSVEMER